MVQNQEEICCAPTPTYLLTGSENQSSAPTYRRPTVTVAPYILRPWLLLWAKGEQSRRNTVNIMRALIAEEWLLFGRRSVYAGGGGLQTIYSRVNSDRWASFTRSRTPSFLDNLRTARSPCGSGRIISLGPFTNVLASSLKPCSRTRERLHSRSIAVVPGRKILQYYDTRGILRDLNTIGDSDAAAPPGSKREGGKAGLPEGYQRDREGNWDNK